MTRVGNHDFARADVTASCVEPNVAPRHGLSTSSSSVPIVQRKFGNTDLRVSLLGLGTAEIGFSSTDDRTLDAILGAASEARLNVLDSAVMYGEAEERLGRLLAGRRDEFVIFTKCGRHMTRLRGLQRGLRKVRRVVGGLVGDPSFEWHPSVLQNNIEESLRRLRTDRIDLMQLHSCSEQILARGDAIRTLQSAKEAGKVRYIGYSGDGAAALWAVRSGLFDAIQLSINVADQQPLDDLIPRAIAAGLGIVAKRPIANAVWRSAERPNDERLRVYWSRMHSLRYDFLADPGAVATALRFTLQTGVHTAIVGTTSVEHMQSNLAAVRDLSASDPYFDAIRERWHQVAMPDWIAQM